MEGASCKPSLARLSDRPPKKPKPDIAFIVGLLVLASPFLFGGCVFLGWQTQLFFDHLNGPLRLESAVFDTSPNGKIRFESEQDGTVRLVEVATGRILQARLLSPETYTNIIVFGWRDNQAVHLSCHLRYGAMAHSLSYLWDSKSGSITDPWSGEVKDFK